MPDGVKAKDVRIEGERRAETRQGRRPQQISPSCARCRRQNQGCGNDELRDERQDPRVDSEDVRQDKRQPEHGSIGQRRVPRHVVDRIRVAARQKLRDCVLDDHEHIATIRVEWPGEDGREQPERNPTEERQAGDRHRCDDERVRPTARSIVDRRRPDSRQQSGERQHEQRPQRISVACAGQRCHQPVSRRNQGEEDDDQGAGDPLHGRKNSRTGVGARSRHPETPCRAVGESCPRADSAAPAARARREVAARERAGVGPREH